jgi:hypothetical protein
MAVELLTIVPRKFAEDVQSTQYTSDNAKTVIDKFTVTNTSLNNLDFSAHLVASGDTADTDNLVLAARTIAAGETYTCPELVGQSLEAGGFISTLAQTASALVLSASGRVVTG